jgi:hypothetical protein
MMKNIDPTRGESKDMPATAVNTGSQRKAEERGKRMVPVWPPIFMIMDDPEEKKVYTWGREGENLELGCDIYPCVGGVRWQIDVGRHVPER